MSTQSPFPFLEGQRLFPLVSLLKKNPKTLFCLFCLIYRISTINLLQRFCFTLAGIKSSPSQRGKIHVVVFFILPPLLLAVWVWGFRDHSGILETRELPEP